MSYEKGKWYLVIESGMWHLAECLGGGMFRDHNGRYFEPSMPVHVREFGGVCGKCLPE